MPMNPTGDRRDLAKIVEKQMRNWELAHAQRPKPDAGEGAADVTDFVTISRTLGSGGSEVATLLGERLDWPVFDREILQAMAGDDELRGRLYRELDERDVSWLETTARWLMGGELRKDDYFYRLSETVLALARHGHAVFLGRGADLILPMDRGVRVRITARPEKRAQTFAQRSGTSPALARAELERVDRERDDFLRQHFGKRADDLLRFDLTLVLDQMGVATAADVIATAVRARVQS